jgi:UDP:flavonoid glycosyltransferase YjiC (YdhE family)
MGEYARCLAVAKGAQRRWPDCTIHFLLSRHAPYTRGTPFPATLLDSSPTFHSAAVIEVLQVFKPDIVIFDNAGRTAQLRAACRAGARVVFISARSRQRRKAFRWRWLRLIDEHWIAYPEFIAGRLSLWERLKLRCFPRSMVRYLDVISSAPDAMQRQAIFLRAGIEPGKYVLIVPGGGTGHPGAPGAIHAFSEASRLLARRGITTVYVGPLAPSDDPSSLPREAHWHAFDSLPQPELIALLSSARVAVVNGGSTLLQAVAAGVACVAVPIAKDQIRRSQRCVAMGVAVQAPSNAVAIMKAAEALLQNDAERTALAGRAAQLHWADGVDIAVRALDGLR